MAGFETVAAFDYEKDAVETFSANHQCVASQQDLTDYDYSGLPSVDVLIGGPPCTQFSTAKNNKTRNILAGMTLVQSFLRAVYVLKPRYWIMENVPAIQNYLPSVIPLSFIGLTEKGNFEIPMKAELLASNYGAPQNRKRYLIGNFPLPKITHGDSGKADLFSEDLPEWRTMGDALAGLPEPLSNRREGYLNDPNYRIPLAFSNLSDHFSDTRFNGLELISLRNAKLEHPYMGRMAWPDRIDRPARTVVATQLGRETLILQSKSGDYRRATVRECATLQSFPITYQFFGKSFASKYRQVGDAVPPLLSFALAKAIAEENGIFVDAPNVHKQIRKVATKLPHRYERKSKGPNFKRRPNFLLPSKEVRGMRSEIKVSGFNSNESRFGGALFYKPIWEPTITLGEGAGSTSSYVVDNEVARQLVQSLTGTVDQKQVFTQWRDATNLLIKKYGLGEEVYFNYVTENATRSPLLMIDAIKAITEQHYPKQQYDSLTVDCSALFDNPKAKKIRYRVLLGAVLANTLSLVWND